MKTLLPALVIIFVFFSIQLHATIIEGQDYTGTTCDYGYDCGSGPIICSDPQDEYLLVVPDDGLLNVSGSIDQLLYNNPDCSGQFLGTASFNIYTKDWVWINGRFGEGSFDYDIGCVAANDTFYILLGGTHSAYSFVFVMEDEPTTNNDSEYNGDANHALDFSPDTNMEGHIGYGTYVRDYNDWYRVVIPEDGTLMATLAADDETYMILRDKYGGWLSQAYSNSISIIDTIIWECLSPGDTFYLVVDDWVCSGYAIYWKVINQTPYTNDQEPNGMLAEAIVLPEDTRMEGRLDYSHYHKDYQDFYLLTASEDGDLQLICDAEMGMVVDLLYTNGALLHRVSFPPGGGQDTLNWTCLAPGDSFYLRLDAIFCGGYGLEWTMVDLPTQVNDMEPNNQMMDANLVADQIVNEGRLSYGYYSNDNQDWYLTNMNGSGSIVVHGYSPESQRLTFLKNSTSLGYEIVEDNFEFYRSCLNASDNIYLLLDDFIGACGGYSFTYDVYYDANDSGAMMDTLDVSQASWHKDNIGFDYWSTTGWDVVDVLHLKPHVGDTALFNIQSWNLIDVCLYDSIGNLLYNDVCPDTLEFLAHLELLKSYYIKISYNGGCTPYRFKYDFPTDCPKDIYLTGQLDESLYKAAGRIISDGTIVGGINVTFRAQEFDLMEAFEVEPTATFKTMVGGCDP